MLIRESRGEIPGFFFLFGLKFTHSLQYHKRMDERYGLYLDGYPKEKPPRYKSKPIIVCGDLNVAASEIDLKNPKRNIGNPGFSPEEREKFQQLLQTGFVDSFRYIHPDETDAYTWWSYRFNARKNNAGWRIDYFLVSDFAKDKIKGSYIRNDVFGSDHCPIVLDIDL